MFLLSYITVCKDYCELGLSFNIWIAVLIKSVISLILLNWIWKLETNLLGFKSRGFLMKLVCRDYRMDILISS